MLMFRRHTHRLTISFFVVLSLLLSQLALANYVCPQQTQGDAMAARMASGMPCEGLDQDQPALCAEYSKAEAQSFETIKLPTVSLPAVVQVLKVPAEPGAAQASAVPWTATPEAQPPPDPLFLTTLRLRV